MLYTRAAKLTAVIIPVLAVILLSGCGSKDDNKLNGDKTISVTVSEAKKGGISAKTVITGKVTPLSEVVIIPKIGGKVAQVPVDVGARVKKGDLLVKLDTTDLDVSPGAGIQGLQNAKLSHDQAVLNYRNAKDNYERLKSLYNEGAVSVQQLEQAELAYNLARNQLDNISNQIAQATITSPIDGEVATRNINPGVRVGVTQPVMSVVNIDKVYIEGTVAESDISVVKEGQKVSVKVDAAGGSFQGAVKTLSPVANPQTKGYPIKIEIDNGNRKLRPGMFAEILLVTRDKQDVVVIPREALVTRGSDKVLYVVKNSAAEERTVETGVEAEDKVEIVKGLAAGEKFVIEGQHSLYDKAKVSVRTGDTAN